ncbi:MAG: serine--tRNA ligase [Bdellovibrionales bacterium GWA2_49_15]|nr:MAG: serine--tRNA ligase [Bdellovibrionales bacterium GWA2_49_15]HAZ14023.1 serine--tRNA ligase [Bdellovibrionales bacterium]
MLDINFIRNNVAVVRKAIKDKAVALDLEKLLKIDQKLKEEKIILQELQTKKNLIAKEVPMKSGADKMALIEEGRKLGVDVSHQNDVVKNTQIEFQNLMWLVPNIPMPDAPIGEDACTNVVIKTVGEKKDFAFPIRNHKELLKLNNWAEFERTVKISGERAYALKGDLVFIEMAIHRLVLHKLRKKKFQIMTVPAFAREEAFIGTGHFPMGKDQVYKLEQDELFMAGTGEVIMNGLHADEIFKKAQLPLLYGAYGPCFRKEAGSAGKDVGGIMRVHQFNKTEQYIICENNPKESGKWHQFMLEIAEEILCDLELPYQIVECCTGDMGLGKYRMNDIEVWVPSEKRYRETHSGSTLHDWQARRTNLRYRDDDGEVKFCHTLNCTGIATPRVLVPLLENHQNSDGTINIPQKLEDFCVF